MSSQSQEVPQAVVPSLSHAPFQYFGGKWEMAKWLVPHIPRGQTLVMTHGGAGSPIWHMDPYPVEVYNDLNHKLVNFFKVCRDNPEALAAAMALTPYSREEWNRCKADEGDAIERARRYGTVARQSMSGAWGRAWSSVVAHSRRKMASGNSRWLHMPETILEIAARFSSVQIECMDAVDLIGHYDRPDTVFYCDPPYHPGTCATGVYEQGMTAEQHGQLLQALKACEGAVIISGYSHPDYEHAMGDWTRVEKSVACRSNVNSDGGNSDRPRRIECLWIKQAGKLSNNPSHPIDSTILA